MDGRWTGSLQAHWWLAVIAVAGLIAHLRVIVPALSRPRPPTLVDTALYEHAGWYLTRGGRLYLDIWEPKPPLPYETTAVLTLLAGPSPYRQHLLATAVSTAASVGVMVVLAVIAVRLTDRRDAGVVAGIAPLLLPGYFYLPAFGFSPKHLVVFTGLLSILLADRDAPALSGIAGVASVGYWQLAVAFPAIALVIVGRRRSRRTLGRFLVAGSVTGGVILAPVVYWGAVPAMIAETVVIPLATPEPQSLVPRAFVATRDLKTGVLAVLLGGAALVLAARRPHRRTWWWVVAGGAWFGLVAYAIDYDSYTDAYPGLVFVALGLAFLTATYPRARPVVVGGTLLVAAVTVLTLGGVFTDPLAVPAHRPLASLVPRPIPGDGAATPVRVLFWEQQVPDTCHYRMSLLERRWLRAAGYSDRCGRLGDAVDLLAGR